MAKLLLIQLIFLQEHMLVSIHLSFQNSIDFIMSLFLCLSLKPGKQPSTLSVLELILFLHYCKQQHILSRSPVQICNTSLCLIQYYIAIFQDEENMQYTLQISICTLLLRVGVALNAVLPCTASAQYQNKTFRVNFPFPSLSPFQPSKGDGMHCWADTHMVQEYPTIAWDPSENSTFIIQKKKKQRTAGAASSQGQWQWSLLAGRHVVHKKARKKMAKSYTAKLLSDKN